MSLKSSSIQSDLKIFQLDEADPTFIFLSVTDKDWVKVRLNLKDRLTKSDIQNY